MKQLKLTFMILIVTLLVLGVRAQHSDSMNTRFDKGDLSFDYPANWKLTDRSTADVQSVTIVPKGSGAEITVIVQAGMNASCDFQVENRRIMHGLERRLVTRIQTATPVQTSPVKVAVGNLDVDGTQISGRMNGKTVTGEVYSLRVNRHFLSLVYLHADNDKVTNSAWALIRRRLVLKPGIITIGATTLNASDASASDRSVNPSRTVARPSIPNNTYHLVQPSYPEIAKKAHATGTVTVQVLIDEAGAVISARPISGHPLLQAVSVAAAQKSDFFPAKQCGEPARVLGVIQYNFVSQ